MLKSIGGIASGRCTEVGRKGVVTRLVPATLCEDLVCAYVELGAGAGGSSLAYLLSPSPTQSGRPSAAGH